MYFSSLIINQSVPRTVTRKVQTTSPKTKKIIPRSRVKPDVDIDFGESILGYGQGYNVRVRESKGSKKFIKVNNDPLPRKKALNLGADYADNTVARTFKIVPADKIVSSSCQGNRPFCVLPHSQTGNL